MSSAPPVCVGFRHLTGWYNSQRVGAAEVQLSTAGRLLPSTLTFGRAGWANPVMITGVGLLTLSVLTSTAGGIGGTGGASGDRSLRTTAAASPLVTGTAVPPWYIIHPVWRCDDWSRRYQCPRDCGESGLAAGRLISAHSVLARLLFFFVYHGGGHERDNGTPPAAVVHYPSRVAEVQSIPVQGVPTGLWGVGFGGSATDAEGVRADPTPLL